jgi:hypothetical protein
MSSEPPDLLDDAWDQEAEEVLAPRLRSRAARWLVALIACLVVAAMILSLLPSARGPSRPDTLGGVVSMVSADGSSFCMILDSTGRSFCSEIVQTTPTRPIAVGQHVTGIVILALGGSSPVPLFVVTGPAASP